MWVFALIFFGSLAVLLAYDAYRAYKYGFNATLSWWIYVNSAQYPIIPAMIGFFVGLLFGHLFWDQMLNVSVCPGVTSQ